MQFTKGNTTVTLDKLWFLQRAHAALAATSQTPELETMTRLVCDAVNAQRSPPSLPTIPTKQQRLKTNPSDLL